MEHYVEELKRFLDRGHSVYHAAAALEEMLKKAGYDRLTEQEDWTLKRGGRYYLIRGGALIAFRLPQGMPAGFLLSAGHADRPAFKVKENGELCGKYTRLATEKYGSMIISTWLDRPLSVAGRVLVERDQGVESCLVDLDRDLFLIPNVAIHMNRKANEGMAWNPAVDTLPLVGSGAAAGKLSALLEQAAGGKILGHDLYLYVRQRACCWGIEEAYISAQGLDDLACVWCCAKGFLNATPTEAVPVLCMFDSEEVGSQSVQGADSAFLEGTLSRICRCMGWEKEQLLSRSFMVSADNAHGLHPNHPEYADEHHAPIVNEGVVLKFNASQRYATDGLSAGVFRKICSAAGVPVQTYYNRADLPGGSTLGSVSLSHVTVPTVDIGLPQLAMHSCYETAGVQDIKYLADAMTAYYGTLLQRNGDGSCFVL